MNQTQIEYFLEVAKTLNFSKAAKNLFVSQSAISKNVSALEEDLNVKLLVRNNKMVALTKNGESFYKFFSKFMKEFNEELEIAHNRIHNEQKKINIGITEGYSIGKYIKYFHEDCSFIDYKIEFDRINQLVKSLYNQKYDFIIGPYRGIIQAVDQENIEGLTIENIKRVKRMIYFSKNHKLANKPNLSILDFKDETFYIGKSQVARKSAEEICKKEGFVGKLEPTRGGDTIGLRVFTDGYALGDEWSRYIHDDDYKYFYINHYQDIGICFVKDLLGEKKLQYIEEIKNVFNKD